jgi:polyhydroxyalkanoate synthase
MAKKRPKADTADPGPGARALAPARNRARAAGNGETPSNGQAAGNGKTAGNGRAADNGKTERGDAGAGAGTGHGYRLVEADPDREPTAIDDLLGVAASPIATIDPNGFARTLAGAARAASRHPLGVATALTRFGTGVASASIAAAGRTVGKERPAPVAPASKDFRFADPTWEHNPAYFLLQQLYLLGGRLVMDTIDAAQLPPADAQKARFAAQLLVDAAAPTNTFVGNPTAIRTAFETGGKSIARGWRNRVHDLRKNGGWPSQVDDSGFVVGRNMAMTPGKVVYRNGLMELIEYTPQTELVHEIPMLFCPPWINKYYIMDLAPGRSLIEWAVRHGHRCFAISYRNPDASMRDVGFDDYLLGGPLDALRVVRAITGQAEVNTVSVCLGGQLTAMAMAYGAATGDEPIHTATLINTHTDYTHPGALAAYTDEVAIEGLEKRMAKKGYLDASDMARTFDALRPNDLIFQYVVNNWLLGKSPPAFDLLAWNADSTRMPAKMHSRYLRSCYLHNEFAQGKFVANGVRLDPRAVRQDTYVLSAIDDHIVPWISAYRTTQLLGGANTFVLSTSGHIAGIVNPPNPKAKHWTNESGLPADPQQWLHGATLHAETWWNNWVPWIAARAGALVPAPRSHGSVTFPALCDAPGTYVHGRSA